MSAMVKVEEDEEEEEVEVEEQVTPERDSSTLFYNRCLKSAVRQVL